MSHLSSLEGQTPRAGLGDSVRHLPGGLQAWPSGWVGSERSGFQFYGWPEILGALDWLRCPGEAGKEARWELGRRLPLTGSCRQVPGLVLVPDPGLAGAFMGFPARLCSPVPGSLGGTSEPCVTWVPYSGTAGRSEGTCAELVGSCCSSCSSSPPSGTGLARLGEGRGP